MGSGKGYLETKSCPKASGTPEGSQSGCHGMTGRELRVGSRETQVLAVPGALCCSLVDSVKNDAQLKMTEDRGRRMADTRGGRAEKA